MQVTTMSEIKIRNGSVVENTLTDETEKSVISEVYALIRYLKNEQGNLRAKVREREREDRDDSSWTLSDDSDIVQFHEYLKNISVHGEAPGKLQRVAAEFRGADYFANHSLGDSVDLAPANDIEQSIADDLFSRRANRDKATTKHFEQHMVPLTPDKEELPMYVASNERNEGLHTFEEGKELWESFLEVIPVSVESGSDTSDETEEQADEQDESDDESDDYLLNGANRVGEEVSGNIREYIVENRVTIDWRDHIDPEASDWNDTVVTEEDAKKRLQQVAIDMDPDDFSEVSDMINEGHVQQAVTVISNYE